MPDPLAHLLSHRLRGFSPHESSLSALRQAVASPARYFEIDTRLTADGEILVFHDARLERLARASGLVREWSVARSGLPLFKGEPEEPVARFEELASAFAAAASGQVLLVDIKDYGAEEEHHRILARYGLLGRVRIVSWLPEVLVRFHALDPTLPLFFSHIPLSRLTPWAGARRGLARLLGSGALLRLAGRLGSRYDIQLSLRDIVLHLDDYDRQPPAGPTPPGELLGGFPTHLLTGLPGGNLGAVLRAAHGSVGIPASLLTPAYAAAAHAAGLQVSIFSLDDPGEVARCLADSRPELIFTNDARLFGRDWRAAAAAG